MIRLHGRRNLPPVLMSFGRHLIYAEGTKTEPLYVEDLKAYISEELNVPKEDIEIITPKANKSLHTVDLVKYAIDDVIKRRKKQETIDYVWVFYDKDEYEDFDDAYRLIVEQNTEHGKSYSCNTTWFACWSNECFEVWAYHYFENLQSQLKRDQYIEKINAFLKKNGCKEEYTKNRKDLHHFLTKYGGSIEKATQFMKKKDVKSSIKPNPSSGIYQFSEYLLAYIKNKNKTVR